MHLYIILLLTFSLSATAEDPRQDKTHPCFIDFPLFCQDQIPGDGNEWECLGKKLNLLTPKCSDFMKEYLGKTNECGKEIFLYCPGNEKNYGRWTDCLLKRRNVLNAKCDKKLLKIKKDRDAFEGF